MVKKYGFIDTFNGRELDVLSNLRTGAKPYGLMEAFPVSREGVTAYPIEVEALLLETNHDVVAVFKGEEVREDKIYKGLEIGRKTKAISIIPVENSRFKKKENAGLTKSLCLIRTKNGMEDKFVQHLDTVDGVTEVDELRGIYSIAARIQTESNKRMEDLISREIIILGMVKNDLIKSVTDLRILKCGFTVDNKGNIADYPVS